MADKSEREKRRLGWHEEVREVPKAGSLIVFIHGLGGNYKKTWGEFPDFLEQDDKFNNTDIYLFGFKSGFLRFFVSPIEALGQRLRTVLLDASCKYEQITVISHSLGGLVVKEAIASILKTGDAHRVNLHHAIFCSTPHLGSVTARFLAFLGGHINQLKVLQPKIIDAHTLWLARINSHKTSPNDIVHERYSKNIDITNIWASNDRIVSFGNATALPSQHTITIEGSHTMMVKPETMDHHVYTTLSEQLVKAPVPKPIESSPSIQILADSAKLGDELKILNTLEIPVKYRALVKRVELKNSESEGEQ
ncbi:esterase/lipase family protein [Paraglaciecola marina]|uniref:esterase/lipase family protein n=1 Tax=Paraglaciecola marina TaxID=2500157 RepID=UPI001061AF3D|nr:hypothetical protein [Paraglaciecola marina]